MFCGKCGTQIPEESKFCPSCGTATTAETPAETVVPVEPAAPAAPAKKKSTPILITFIMSLLILAGSIVIPLNKPVEEVPILNLIMTATMSEQEWIDAIEQEATLLALQGSVSSSSQDVVEAEPEDAMEETVEAVIEEAHDSDGDRVMIDHEGTPAGKLNKAIEKLEDKFTVLNLKAAFDALDAVGKTVPDYDNTAVTGFSTVMTVILAVSIGMFVLPLLFTLLGGLKKSAGCTITALILGAAPQFLFSGVVCFLGSAIVLITQAVLCSKYKKALKQAQ